MMKNGDEGIGSRTMKNNYNFNLADALGINDTT